MLPHSRHNARPPHLLSRASAASLPIVTYVVERCDAAAPTPTTPLIYTHNIVRISYHLHFANLYIRERIHFVGDGGGGHNGERSEPPRA